MGFLFRFLQWQGFDVSNTIIAVINFFGDFVVKIIFLLFFNSIVAFAEIVPIYFSPFLFNQYGDRIELRTSTGMPAPGLLQYNSQTFEYRAVSSIGQQLFLKGPNGQNTTSFVGPVYKTREDAFKYLKTTLLSSDISPALITIIEKGCWEKSGFAVPACFEKGNQFSLSKAEAKNYIDPIKSLSLFICKSSEDSSLEENTRCVEEIFKNSKNQKLENVASKCTLFVQTKLDQQKTVGRFLRSVLTPKGIRPNDWPWGEHLKCLETN